MRSVSKVFAEYHAVHPARATECGHRVDGEAVARAADDRRAPLGTPGAAGDLVGEEHLTTLSLRLRVDRCPGLLPPDADRFRILLHGPLVRALEGQAPAAQVPAHALLSQPHPVRLRDQISYLSCPASPRSQGRWPSTNCRIARCSIASRTLCSPTRRPRDRPPVLRARRPATSPPVVHLLERDLEHRRDILASPSSHQGGHRPKPNCLLRRLRQLPCALQHSHIDHRPRTPTVSDR